MFVHPPAQTSHSHFTFKPRSSARSWHLNHQYNNLSPALLRHPSLISYSLILITAFLSTIAQKDWSSMPLDGVVKTWPRILLRAESVTVFAASLWAYKRSGASWWLFAGGLLLPDLGMLGFLADTVTGSATYNSFHTETPPILLLCAGYARQSSDLISTGLIWLAHIHSWSSLLRFCFFASKYLPCALFTVDRMLGFGLKYGTGFGHTHLGLVQGHKSVE